MFNEDMKLLKWLQLTSPDGGARWQSPPPRKRLGLDALATIVSKFK